MTATIPAKFPLRKIFETFPVTYNDSLNTILRLEVGTYNLLLNCIKKSLDLVEQALKGEIVMSVEIEGIFANILQNRIPEQWKKFSYLSLRSMKGYLADLEERVDFFRKWIAGGGPSPTKFWISGFFFPQSFLTSILQNYARKHSVTVESVLFR